MIRFQLWLAVLSLFVALAHTELERIPEASSAIGANWVRQGESEEDLSWMLTHRICVCGFWKTVTAG